MIAEALISISIFGQGNWVCGNESVYSDGMIETIISHVITHDDLSYEEMLVTQYRKAKTESPQSQVTAHITGKKEVTGKSFKAIPKEVNVHIDFDKLNVFTEKYMKALDGFYLEPSSSIEVLKVTDKEMRLKDKESGQETSCYATQKQIYHANKCACSLTENRPES